MREKHLLSEARQCRNTLALSQRLSVAQSCFSAKAFLKCFHIFHCEFVR